MAISKERKRLLRIDAIGDAMSILDTASQNADMTPSAAFPEGGQSVTPEEYRFWLDQFRLLGDSLNSKIARLER